MRFSDVPREAHEAMLLAARDYYRGLKKQPRLSFKRDVLWIMVHHPHGHESWAPYALREKSRKGPRPYEVRNWFCAGQALQTMVRTGKSLKPAACLLDTATMADNFMLTHSGGKDWAARMVRQVLDGKRPMARLPLRVGRKHFLSERVLRCVVEALGLGYHLSRNPRGWLEAAIFQRGATLARFYTPGAVIPQFEAAGFPLKAEAFETPLDEYAERMNAPDLGGDHPMLGMCSGHPVHECVAALPPRLLGRRIISGTPARPASTC
jgi:hypothetical protein